MSGRTRTSVPQRRSGRWGAQPGETTVPDSIRRRREMSASVRRRRLVVLDLAVGAAIAIIVLLLGFGFAPVGIIAALVLIACGFSYLLARRRAGRARRASRARRSGTADRRVLPAPDEGALMDRRSTL